MRLQRQYFTESPVALLTAASAAAKSASVHAAGVKKRMEYLHTSGSSTLRIWFTAPHSIDTVSERAGPFQHVCPFVNLISA
mmetsp:Transcript_14133/g.29905  ORF Transcript_14133/g.29905 Transcript_14133/m.29905 type:complete len:81 (+) Transcript_14133:3-245(+)